MEDWNRNEPGKKPLCIVGAGFQCGVLTRILPTTENLIGETVDGPHKKEFPILRQLIKRVGNTKLNFIWTNIESIAGSLSGLSEQFIQEYGEIADGSHIKKLAKRLAREHPPENFICLLLGLELKRMIAMQYADHNCHVQPKCNSPTGLDRLTQRKGVTWILLNYDLVLERFFESRKARWHYAFQGHLSEAATCTEAGHVVIKPHGSLNIWFESVWSSPPLHDVRFVDENNLLATCPIDEIGDISTSTPVTELRPCMIGYVPEIKKDEVNSPGEFADFAHDLCKWNLAYAALALRHATALYILGYSMPPEDEWVWSRLRAIRKKTFPIYVASASHSDGIVERLKDCGFTRVQRIGDDGRI